MKRALVTGITGQDGFYLSRLLVDQGYYVCGLIRGQSNPKRAMVERDLPNVELVEGDITDYSSLVSVLRYVQPDEVYNLAAISHVGISFKQPENTANVSGLGALRLLEAIRTVSPDCKFYQASTSELYGKVRETPQSETTPFYPRSPYGTAKAFAHYTTVNYRESYGMFTCCGILFNHESERRGYEFVTRKVTQAAARIKLGVQDNLMLGNLDSERDWGYAGDYVKAMYLMMQQPVPEDYVVATGIKHSIRDLLNIAFQAVDLDWRQHVVQDPRFMRPAEVDLLQGDPSKAATKLAWRPSVSFREMIINMVANDLFIEKRKINGLSKV